MEPENLHLLKLYVDFKTKGKMYWEDKRFDKLSISERSSYVGYVMQNPNHMICEK